MAQFATTAEFANRLGVDLTGGETTDAAGLLVLASGLIQGEAGQLIEEVLNDTLTRPGVWSSRLRLPERPVQAVDSVELDGTLLSADEWYLDGDELVRPRTLSTSSFPQVPGGGWGGPEAELEIVYDHGYAAAAIPGTIKAVCLEMVVRVWVNPGSVRQEGYGSEQVAYSSANGLLLTETERRVVREAVRRHAGSVVLR